MKRRIKGKKKIQQKKILILAGAILAAVLLLVLVSYFLLRAKVNQTPKDTILNHVYIEQVDVSGMKAKEAKKAVEKQVAKYQEDKVTLIAEEASIEVTLEQLGFDIADVDKLVNKAVSYGKSGGVWSRYAKIKKLEKDNKVFDVKYIVDADVISTTIEEKMPHLANEAVDATIKRSGNSFVITDEKKGKQIHIDESIEAIEAFFKGDWQSAEHKIELVTMVAEPKITRAQLETIQDVLGTFSTYCGTSGGRVQNVVTGANHIGGTVLMPGETFSANAAMEPYTVENGYTEAGAYENGKVVQSMGGGICQVSSTLYNAVLLSELEIVTRAPHSMTVGYVDPSRDAAIAGDYKDLQFKNNQDTPIYIESQMSGGNLIFTIYGKETRPSNRKVEFVSEVISSTPAKKNFVASGDALGVIKKVDGGHTGMKAKLWKVVYEDGVEVSRKGVNNSTYAASDATYSVGTASNNPEATALVNNAIATNDEAQINAAITSAKALIESMTENTTENAATPAQ